MKKYYKMHNCLFYEIDTAQAALNVKSNYLAPWISTEGGRHSNYSFLCIFYHGKACLGPHEFTSFSCWTFSRLLDTNYKKRSQVAVLRASLWWCLCSKNWWSCCYSNVNVTSVQKLDNWLLKPLLNELFIHVQNNNNPTTTVLWSPNTLSEWWLNQ